MVPLLEEFFVVTSGSLAFVVWVDQEEVFVVLIWGFTNTLLGPNAERKRIWKHLVVVLVKLRLIPRRLLHMIVLWYLLFVIEVFVPSFFNKLTIHIYSFRDLTFFYQRGEMHPLILIWNLIWPVIHLILSLKVNVLNFHFDLLPSIWSGLVSWRLNPFVLVAFLRVLILMLSHLRLVLRAYLV